MTIEDIPRALKELNDRYPEYEFFARLRKENNKRKAMGAEISGFQKKEEATDTKEVDDEDKQKERDLYCKEYGHEVYLYLKKGECYCRKCGKRGKREDFHK